MASTFGTIAGRPGPACWDATTGARRQASGATIPGSRASKQRVPRGRGTRRRPRPPPGPSTTGPAPDDRLPDAAVREPDADEPGQQVVLDQAAPRLRRGPGSGGTCSRPAARGGGCARAAPWRSTLARIPSARRAPRRCVLAYASGVRISVRTARAAAIASALPNSVPPDRDEVRALAVRPLRLVEDLGDRVGHAPRPERHAAGDRLAARHEVGLEAPLRR